MWESKMSTFFTEPEVTLQWGIFWFVLRASIYYCSHLYPLLTPSVSQIAAARQPTHPKTHKTPFHPNAAPLPSPDKQFLHIWQIIIVVIKVTKHKHWKQTSSVHIKAEYKYYIFTHKKFMLQLAWKEKEKKKHHHVIQMSVFTIKRSKISVCHLVSVQNVCVM